MGCATKIKMSNVSSTIVNDMNSCRTSFGKCRKAQYSSTSIVGNCKEDLSKCPAGGNGTSAGGNSTTAKPTTAKPTTAKPTTTTAKPTTTTAKPTTAAANTTAAATTTTAAATTTLAPVATLAPAVADEAAKGALTSFSTPEDKKILAEAAAQNEVVSVAASDTVNAVVTQAEKRRKKRSTRSTITTCKQATEAVSNYTDRACPQTKDYPDEAASACVARITKANPKIMKLTNKLGLQLYAMKDELVAAAKGCTADDIANLKKSQASTDAAKTAAAQLKAALMDDPAFTYVPQSINDVTKDVEAATAGLNLDDLAHIISGELAAVPTTTTTTTTTTVTTTVTTTITTTASNSTSNRTRVANKDAYFNDINNGPRIVNLEGYFNNGAKAAAANTQATANNGKLRRRRSGTW